MGKLSPDQVERERAEVVPELKLYNWEVVNYWILSRTVFNNLENSKYEVRRTEHTYDDYPEQRAVF